VLSSASPPVDPPEYCPAGSTYEHSRGYRPLPGDSCVGGLDLRPLVRNCPIPSDSSTASKAWIAILVVVLVLAVLAAGAFFVYRNENMRRRVVDAVGDLGTKIAGIRAGQSSRYNRLGSGGPRASSDEEFGIGGEVDPDLDVEEDARVLQDNEILSATAIPSETSINGDSFNPRT